MKRGVALAIDAGINYFDTARLYGNGQSETNLGQVLRDLSADVVVGTKVKLEAPDMHDIEGAVVAHVEGSLKRLRRESVDVVSLHHPVGASRDIDRQILDLNDVAAAAEAFSKLVEQGKIRYWGMNAVGDTEIVHKALEAAHPFAVQAVYNLLNPSGSIQVRAGFPFQDYQGVIHAAAERGIGVFGIRVLAGGALTGTAARHPNASPAPTPMASSRTYNDDLERAQAFRFLSEDGYTDSMAEASVRFVISNSDISTALVGIASIEQLQQALVSAAKGPLPTEALEKLQSTWESFARAG
jgi:L-galactose dehydrogenase/L-glyceraldehyde 3-phosphate reductase